MYRAIIRLLFTLICCWPTLAGAAADYSIHAEWTSYTPPNGFTVTGFRLYQEGTLACQNQNPNATAIDCTVSLTADTTNFTLAAAFSDGTESPHSLPFPFSIPTESNTATAPAATVPPTAVISSSVAAGNVPLTVVFSGAGSQATANASITAYSWNFSDGTSAAGASTSHTFTTAGTYTTTLTVTDSKGLTSSANTPIVATAAKTTATNTLPNKTPTAIVSATPSIGSVPLTVTFDGSASADTDGTIASYVWNFGDGSTAIGKTATHTYTTAATFNATLQVTDNQGAAGSANKIITTTAADPLADLNIELGEVEVSSTWVRVTFTSTFTNPIVVAGPPSFNNTEPCTVRLRNVDSTGFDIKLTEWNYQDGAHSEETITFLVMEKGRITLPDGSAVEAGSFIGTTMFKTVLFTGVFAKEPVMLTTIASTNEADTISGRIRNIKSSSFDYYFREQERNKNTHLKETVNFIAWEPGKGNIGSVQFEVATTARQVSHAWYNGSFKQSFTRAPLLLIDMQTTSNIDTSALRVQEIASTGFQVKVEEEQSRDKEVIHPAETVGFFAINPTEDN